MRRRSRLHQVFPNMSADEANMMEEVKEKEVKEKQGAAEEEVVDMEVEEEQKVDGLEVLAAQIAQVEADIMEARGEWKSAASADKQFWLKEVEAGKKEEALRQEKAILLQQRQGTMSTVGCAV